MATARTWDYTRPRVWDHSRRRPTTPTWPARARAWVDAKVRRLRMAWAIWSTILGWSDAELCDTAFFLDWWPKACEADRGVVCEVTRTLRHPAWPAAQAAVAQTSVTLRLQRKQSWIALSRSIRDREAWAESMWRHLYAMRLMDLHAPATTRLSTHQRHVLTELAYMHYSRTGQRQRGVTSAQL